MGTGSKHTQVSVPPHDAPGRVSTGSKRPKMFQSDSDDDGPPRDVPGLGGTGSQPAKLFQSGCVDDGPPHDAPELVGTKGRGPKMFKSESDDDGPPNDDTGLVGSGRGTHVMPMDSTTVDDGTLRLSAANTYEWGDPKYARAAGHVLNAPMLESIESA